MFGREVVEGEQRLMILRQAFAGPVRPFVLPGLSLIRDRGTTMRGQGGLKSSSISVNFIFGMPCSLIRPVGRDGPRASDLA